MSGERAFLTPPEQVRAAEAGWDALRAEWTRLVGGACVLPLDDTWPDLGYAFKRALREFADAAVRSALTTEDAS